MANNDIIVADNPRAQRFEIWFDGVMAGKAVYRPSPGRLVFVHTEIQPARRGKGLGSRLVDEALNQARARGLTVGASCGFFRRQMTASRSRT
jgi:predicted GNAT family acetyltransferase